MSEYTKTPWKVGWGCQIFEGATDRAIALAAGEGSSFDGGKNEANARHIVKCVNHFEEMREALKAFARYMQHRPKGLEAEAAYYDARAILAKIEAGE